MGLLNRIFGHQLRVRVDRSPPVARPMTEQERHDAIARFLEMPVSDQMAQASRLASLLGLSEPSSSVKK
jgi:hypothetical protein